MLEEQRGMHRDVAHFFDVLGHGRCAVACLSSLSRPLRRARRMRQRRRAKKKRRRGRRWGGSWFALRLRARRHAPSTVLVTLGRQAVGPSVCNRVGTRHLDDPPPSPNYGRRVLGHAAISDRAIAPPTPALKLGEKHHVESLPTLRCCRLLQDGVLPRPHQGCSQRPRPASSSGSTHHQDSCERAEEQRRGD